MAYKYERSNYEIMRALVNYAVQDREGMLACLSQDGRGKPVVPDDIEYVREINSLIVDFMKFDLNNRLGHFTKRNLDDAMKAMDEAQESND